MPTEVEGTSVTLIPTHSRDTPPHIDSDSTPKVTDLKVNETLESIEGLIDNIPEGAKIVNYKSEAIPRLLSPHDCVKAKPKLRIIKAIELGYGYLRQPTLKQSFELTCSNFRRPVLVTAYEAMERTIQEFRVIRHNGEIIGAAPRPENLARVIKLLMSIKKCFWEQIVMKSLSIPDLPILARNNNPQLWWNINNYEILSAAFQHEVE